jgi:hypothetical protein
MVKVTPVEQEMLVNAEPVVFSPEAGAWGRKGCTRVNLKAAKIATMRRALAAAWQLAAPESLAQQFPSEAAVEKPHTKPEAASKQRIHRPAKRPRNPRKLS